MCKPCNSWLFFKDSALNSFLFFSSSVYPYFLRPAGQSKAKQSFKPFPAPLLCIRLWFNVPLSLVQEGELSLLMMFWRLNCFQLQKLWGLRSGPEPWDLPRFQYSWNIPYSAYSTFNESINDACALYISELGHTTAVDRRSTTTATIEDTKEENNIENVIFINITLMLTDWWTGWKVNVG